MKSATTHNYKVVGRNGQVCLGKGFAGKLMELTDYGNGVLLLKTGSFVSEFDSRVLADGWEARLQETQARLDRKEVTVDIEGEPRASSKRSRKRE